MKKLQLSNDSNRISDSPAAARLRRRVSFLHYLQHYYDTTYIVLVLCSVVQKYI